MLCVRPKGHPRGAQIFIKDVMNSVAVDPRREVFVPTATLPAAICGRARQELKRFLDYLRGENIDEVHIMNDRLDLALLQKKEEQERHDASGGATVSTDRDADIAKGQKLVPNADGNTSGPAPQGIFLRLDSVLDFSWNERILGEREKKGPLTCVYLWIIATEALELRPNATVFMHQLEVVVADGFLGSAANEIHIKRSFHDGTLMLKRRGDPDISEFEEPGKEKMCVGR